MVAVLVWGPDTVPDTYHVEVMVKVKVSPTAKSVVPCLIMNVSPSWLYVLHLGVVLCLFVTFPYSKFAHLLYRTLAMIHERMSMSDEAMS